MKKITLFLALLFSAVVVKAIDPAEDLRIKETGQFFVISIVPKSKQTHFYIAGHKKATLNFDKLQLRGTYVVDGKEMPFSLTKQKDFYVTEAPIQGREIKLEVKEDTNKVDQFRIELKKD